MQQQNNSHHRRKETVSGFIVPEQWDENFRVTEAVIACDGERDIRVENLTTFPSLLTLARQKAAVTGTIRTVGAVELIFIESFMPIIPAEPL